MLLRVLHKWKDDGCVARYVAGRLSSRRGPLLSYILYVIERNTLRDNCIIDDKVRDLCAECPWYIESLRNAGVCNQLLPFSS